MEIDTVIIPIFWMRKPKHREVKVTQPGSSGEEASPAQDSSALPFFSVLPPLRRALLCGQFRGGWMSSVGGQRATSGGRWGVNSESLMERFLGV